MGGEPTAERKAQKGKTMNTTPVVAPEKITRRFAYNAVLSGNVDAQTLQWFADELAKMDKANADRQSKPSKKEQENQPIKDSILTLLTDSGPKVASEVGEALDISTAKASALCRQMVESGLLTVAEIKSPKKGGGKVKQYTAVKVEADEDEETVDGVIVIEVEEGVVTV